MSITKLSVVGMRRCGEANRRLREGNGGPNVDLDMYMFMPFGWNF